MLQTLLISCRWHAIKEGLSCGSQDCFYEQGKLLFDGQDASVWVHGQHRAEERVEQGIKVGGEELRTPLLQIASS